MLVWLFQQLLSGFLANSQFNHVSRLSANDTCDNKVKPGAVHISPGIYVTTEVNPGKFQLGDRLMKAVGPVIASNGVRYLQMRSVGSHNKSGMEKEVKKERTAWII